jgi:hypothetical protein
MPSSQINLWLVASHPIFIADRACYYSQHSQEVSITQSFALYAIRPIMREKDSL